MISLSCHVTARFTFRRGDSADVCNPFIRSLRALKFNEVWIVLLGNYEIDQDNESLVSKKQQKGQQVH